MKRINWWYPGDFMAAMTLVVVLGLIVSAVLIFGCTPHVHPIDVSAERVEETPQRVHDIQWPCDRCGDIAVEDVSEVEGEHSWRCKRCLPRDVMPRQRRLKPTRLGTSIAKGNEHES